MSVDRFRLIVFDLDGTLVDSRRDLAESVNALLVECGARPLDEDAVGRMVGDGAATLVARAFTASGADKSTDALDRFLALYQRRLLTHTRPYAGIPDVLVELSSRAKLAVLTNKPMASSLEILDGLDLARYFPPGAVVGGDGPFPRKPDPTGLLHLIARAGEPLNAAVMVGDSLIDWRTARQASTAICLARYGFGFQGFPVEELGPEDRVADAASDLLALSSPEW